jgi:hypothetical protein
VTESSQVHAVARRALAPYGIYERIDTPISAGLPDVHYVLRKCAGWVEEKVIPPSGACPDHFTLDQLLWAERYVAAGGRWHLLGLREGHRPTERAPSERQWWLLDAASARRWFDGYDPQPTVLGGPHFPKRAVLDAIAPLLGRERRTA